MADTPFHIQMDDLCIINDSTRVLEESFQPNIGASEISFTDFCELTLRTEPQ